MSLARVLVPDYFGQQVLAALRSLGRAGDACDLATWSRAASFFLFRSRAVRRLLRIPSPVANEAQFAAVVKERAAEGGYDLVLPCGLRATRAIVRHQEEISRHAGVMLPGPETFALAEDKRRVAELCREVGIAQPRWGTARGPDDVLAAGRELGYPLVIKTPLGSGVRDGLRYANGPDEVARHLDALGRASGARATPELMVQEFVPGFIHDACTLAADGRALAIVTQERRIMFPIYGGVGAVAVTTHEPRLAELARRLLETLRWHGPAQIEFKLDPRDGAYKLIEMNPKLWGTLDLSIRAGADFPGMIRDWVLGGRVEPLRGHAAGLRYKFWLPQASISYLQLIRRFGLRSAFDRKAYARTVSDLTWSDPGPLFFFALRTLGGLFAGDARAANANLEDRFINRLDGASLPRSMGC